uniref:Superoxide dismutase copper/zinc binding domain-containing protein n=1 Tax=Electrophorus electricus TaxID=8005 RepID=A0A4W4F972_ELEEL
HISYLIQLFLFIFQVLLPGHVTLSILLSLIKGYLTFHQPSPFDLTTVTMNLTGLDRRIGPYHVHLFPTPELRSPPESACSNNNVGGHWNPFGIDTQASVYPPPSNSTHDFYEVGDLSARHWLLGNMSDFQGSVTDWNLPLFGRNSIVGRSVVLHDNHGNVYDFKKNGLCLFVIKLGARQNRGQQICIELVYGSIF